ncbi:ABC transporter ATP-binding protein [Nocardia speluncae]|uniref:ABC transporter ATP-binding protein n=1 Tax=Nocardia speluncae TaxID=419477 RepID=A0A846XE68_9NOCA|nr:ABC transporter ATP-binding protein [Nocardia speluncae]NKY33479.1 ABC transporter ATP-binding protein [Nocardia speluncae]
MPTLELDGITKRFGPVRANDGISFTLGPGEVLAVVGENGAGKTTLMSILYGLVSPDSGRIVLDGQPVEFASAAEAIAHGLGMVFQHFQLFGELSVAENICYGAEPGRWGVLRRTEAVRRVTALAAEHGLAVPVHEPVAGLPVGVLQRIEILKALYRGAELLILDEPTGVLTPQEARALFRVLRTFTAQGRSVVLITHKLDEVMAVADRVIVLRDGRKVFESAVAATGTTELARHMTGRLVDPRPRRAGGPAGGPVLRVTGARTALSGPGALHDISLTVRAGEIVGIAGVAGNGQETLAAVLAGHQMLTSGSIELNGAEMTELDNGGRRRAGLAHIPEDRYRDGVAADGSVAVNLAAGFHRHPPLAIRGILRPRALRAHARDLIGRFGIKVADPADPVRALSGGNTQKLVVARELAHSAQLLVAEQPTRGVDLGAVEFIYECLDEYRAGGGAVLLISSDLAELRALSDRIVVLSAGVISGELDAAAADPETIGILMSGGTVPEASVPERDAVVAEVAG